MPFWDPYFGWDFHAMGQALFAVGFVAIFLALFGSTEHNDMFYLYRGLGEWLASRMELVIGSSILILVAGFYYWRMQGGDF